MRKYFITMAVAASVVTFSAPSTAQYSQLNPRSHYGQNNYGQVRNLEVRIDAIQRQIERLVRRSVLSNHEARKLSSEARNIEHRLDRAARSGLNRWERSDINQRIYRLEQNVRREANDRNRR